MSGKQVERRRAAAKAAAICLRSACEVRTAVQKIGYPERVRETKPPAGGGGNHPLAGRGLNARRTMRAGACALAQVHTNPGPRPVASFRRNCVGR
jgi:hypothetical protein